MKKFTHINYVQGVTMKMMITRMRNIAGSLLCVVACALPASTCLHAQIATDTTLWKYRTGLIPADWNTNTTAGYDAGWPVAGLGKISCVQSYVAGAQPIWTKPYGDPYQTVVFRRTFQLSSTCGMDTLHVRADDSFAVWVNGNFVGSADGWGTEHLYNVSPYMQCGTNLIAVKAKDKHAACWWMALRLDTNMLPGTPPDIHLTASHICPGQPFTLTVSPVPLCPGGNSYAWTGPGGFHATTTAPFLAIGPWSLTGYSSGTFTVIATNPCGADTASVVVTIPPRPLLPDITASDTVICRGTSVTLSVPAGYPGYEWSTGATTNSITVTPRSTHTYTVTISVIIGGDTCQYDRSFTVTVLAPPSVTISGSVEASFCSTTVTLTANVTGGATPIFYTWSPGGAHTASITVSPAAATTYTVIATNLCGADTAVYTYTPCQQLYGSFPDIVATNAMTATSNFVAFQSGMATGVTPAYNATGYRLRIYNRWGGMIYEGIGTATPCTGFWNGQIRWDGSGGDPNNVFAYTVELSNCNHSYTLVKSGNVTYLGKPVKGEPQENQEAKPGLAISSIAPDPSSGLITVSFTVPEGAGQVTLQVYTISGNMALPPLTTTLSTGAHQQTIDVSGLQSGRYYCRAECAGQAVLHPFTVVK